MSGKSYLSRTIGAQLEVQSPAPGGQSRAITCCTSTPVTWHGSTRPSPGRHLWRKPLPDQLRSQSPSPSIGSSGVITSFIATYPTSPHHVQKPPADHVLELALQKANRPAIPVVVAAGLRSVRNQGQTNLAIHNSLSNEIERRET